MNLIEQLAEKYFNEKSALIDNHSGRNVDEIKEALKKSDFELITEIHNTTSEQIYVFKLCKVYQKTELSFINPELLNVKIK